MGERTGIAWTTHTFNVAWGCDEVSPGCDHCYARTLAERLSFPVWGEGARRRLFGDAHWQEPLRWNRSAERAGQRAQVFCSSMADVFDAHAAIVGQLPRLWALIRSTPWLDWQLLTKRHGRIARSLPSDWGAGYPNVWLMVSAESREWWIRRVTVLRAIPARVRGVSAEPLLGDLELSAEDLAGVHWVVFGGESGRRFEARSCDVGWIRQGVRACRAAGVAPFVKQLGRWIAGDHEEFPGVVQEWRLGSLRTFVPPIIGPRAHDRPPGATAFNLTDAKGGNPAEWPTDLRVRELPVVRAA